MVTPLNTLELPSVVWRLVCAGFCITIAILFNPDFPLGASSTLFECWRRIFGYFFRSSLQIASYFRLIHVKTARKVHPPSSQILMEILGLSWVCFRSFIKFCIGNLSCFAIFLNTPKLSFLWSSRIDIAIFALPMHIFFLRQFFVLTGWKRRRKRVLKQAH
jgi:hypothetical protein